MLRRGLHIALLGALGLAACQPETTAVNETMLPPIETSAYDDFSSSGSVTQQRVEDLIRLRAAFERGQLLGQILTLDINGDTQITAEEVKLALSLPGWSTKPAAIERVIDSDVNGDGVITLEEASRYSRVLHAQSTAISTPPIGNYLMLSDLNEDGIVTRDEMKTYLNRFLSRS